MISTVKEIVSQLEYDRKILLAMDEHFDGYELTAQLEFVDKLLAMIEVPDEG